MSAAGTLNRFYGKFFMQCADFSICPYTFTLTAFLDPQQPKTEELILGVAACVFLSTAVPILPTLTSMTMASAALAACMVLASMFIAYPVAFLLDALGDCESRNQQELYVYS